MVTLVPSQAWETLTGEQVGESESKVWGAGWTIDPKKEDEVRADLNHREKVSRPGRPGVRSAGTDATLLTTRLPLLLLQNGYSVQTVDLWNHDDEGNEHVVVHGATLYIGTTDNEAFGEQHTRSRVSPAVALSSSLTRVHSSDRLSRIRASGDPFPTDSLDRRTLRA